MKNLELKLELQPCFSQKPVRKAMFSAYVKIKNTNKIMLKQNRVKRCWSDMIHSTTARIQVKTEKFKIMSVCIIRHFIKLQRVVSVGTFTLFCSTVSRPPVTCQLLYTTQDSSILAASETKHEPISELFLDGSFIEAVLNK